VGRIPLMEHKDFDVAEKFFQKWGGVAVFVGRCVPLVRSFISIPAGIERMPILKFTAYTVLGSGIWNGIWIGLGYAFGPAIQPILEEWSGVLSNAVVVAIFVLMVWFAIVLIRRRLSARKLAAELD
jgi:membrane protein DedA with SNARE-associated domain